MGIYSGSGTLQLGGEQGKQLTVQAGDIIVIPAGTGHKNLGDQDNFGVVGAYPEGNTWDVVRGQPGDRPKADQNIVAVRFPATDPLHGKDGGLLEIWKRTL